VRHRPVGLEKLEATMASAGSGGGVYVGRWEGRRIGGASRRCSASFSIGLGIEVGQLLWQ
jgi:hypothetical protein